MAIPPEVRRRLPRASLLCVRWITWPHWSRWYIARFRLANAIQYVVGPITIVHRAPWLERPARQLHPHSFYNIPPEEGMGL